MKTRIFKWLAIEAFCPFFMVLVIIYLSANISVAQKIPNNIKHADFMAKTNFLDIIKSDTLKNKFITPENEEVEKIPKNLKVPIKYRAANHSGNVDLLFTPNTSNSPPPTLNFLGLDDNGGAVPPDVSGTAGINHLMITLNSQVRIQSKTGLTISTTNLSAFWSSFSLYSPYDPRVIYDPFQDRYITIAVDAFPGHTNASLLIGVSQTNDPTGTWNLYRILAGSNYWFDYPRIGFNNKWIVVHVGAFPITSGTNTSFIFCFDKSNLYGGGAGNYTLLQNVSGGNQPTPAMTYDNNISSMFLVEDWTPNLNGNGYLRLYKISGSIGSEVLTTIGYPSAPYPWSINSVYGPQLSTTIKLSTNDTRISGVVFKNGNLWCTHSISLPAGTSPTRTAVQWWKIDTVGTVLQVGRIDDNSGINFFAQPTIAVNSNGDVLIGHSKFSPNIYASGSYSYRPTYETTNTFETDYILKGGLAVYERFPSYGLCRWGDYTSALIDPNQLDFWTLQMYASTPSGGYDRWGTWWGKIGCTSPLIPGIPTGPNQVCNNDTTNYSSTGAPGATSYLWQISPSNAGTINGSGLTCSIAWNNTYSGSANVSVQGVNLCNTGPSSTSLAVTINQPPTSLPTITPSGATTFCQGGSVDLTASAAVSYLWSTGATTQTISISVSGSYTVTDTYLTDCQATSLPTVVTVYPLPQAIITPNGPTSFCQGDSVTLTANPATSYFWSTGATSQSIIVSTSGSYSVTITDLNGCSATSSPSEITVYPLPSVTVTPDGPTTFCQGENVVLTANSATSYLWNTGATTQSITINVSGSYFVTIIDVHGCSATSSLTTVVVNPVPPIPTITAVETTLTSSSISGNQWYLDGILINGATSQVYIVTQSGDYTVVVTDSNACSSTSEPYTYLFSGISATNPNSYFIIVPNPNSGKFHIETGNFHPTRIKIFNLISEVIYQEEYKNTEIDLSTFPNGIYFLELESNDVTIIRKLIIK
jgi:hypothetical protein